MTTKSQAQANEVAALVRARNPIIWIKTTEEARVEGYLLNAATDAGYVPRTWDVAQGIADLSGKIEDASKADPDKALEEIRARATGQGPAQRGVWIMRDLASWLSGPGGAVTLRRLKNLARLLPGVARDRAQTIIVLTSAEVPPELSGQVAVVEWPLPDREEIEDILGEALDALPDEYKAKAAPKNGTRDAAIDAAVGLSGEQAQACYAKSLVQLERIDPAAVAKEKKRVISNERALEWFDPLPGGLDWVGGLENLKEWLKNRTIAWSVKAREYGLPMPKGIFLTGVSGCGKTLFGKAVAAKLGVPLIRWDLNATRSKYVGESESGIRRSLETIEATGRCVVLIDEIEKALQGATSGSADGGVSADALGTVLTWMQERQGEAFVIATANDIEGLPPELLRKGRFDEVFFVDLPNRTERIAVLKAAMKQYGRDPKAIDVNAEIVADETEGFTGSEIAQLVPEAMFIAFSDGAREIGTVDLLAARKGIVPLSITAKDKIEAIRKWGEKNARRASAVEETTAQTKKAGRVLDFAK